MKKKHFCKAQMAQRMHTIRAAHDRCSTDYDAVTLNTLRKVAHAIGRDFGSNWAETNTGNKI